MELLHPTIHLQLLFDHGDPNLIIPVLFTSLWSFRHFNSANLAWSSPRGFGTIANFIVGGFFHGFGDFSLLGHGDCFVDLIGFLSQFISITYFFSYDQQRLTFNL
jgi:hypothetical protein